MAFLNISLTKVLFLWTKLFLNRSPPKDQTILYLWKTLKGYLKDHLQTPNLTKGFFLETKTQKRLVFKKVKNPQFSEELNTSEWRWVHMKPSNDPWFIETLSKVLLKFMKFYDPPTTF